MLKQHNKTVLIYFTICLFTDLEGFAEGDILGRSGAAWSVKSLPVWTWGDLL